jgi:hypothetical protein
LKVLSAAHGIARCLAAADNRFVGKVVGEFAGAVRGFIQRLSGASAKRSHIFENAANGFAAISAGIPQATSLSATARDSARGLVENSTLSVLP